MHKFSVCLISLYSDIYGNLKTNKMEVENKQENNDIKNNEEIQKESLLIKLFLNNKTIF